MRRQHPISDEALADAQSAIDRGETWLTYNVQTYLLESTDIYFFRSEEEANRFVGEMKDAGEEFGVVQTVSIKDLFEHLPYELHLSSQKIVTMNEKNLQYLQDNLKYMGFGDRLQDDLRRSLSEGKPSFTLEFQTEFNKRSLSATLHFRRPENSDMYFFNKWDGKLLTDVGKTEQTFYLNKGQGVTLKEGFNLMEGRAVHKEMQTREGEKYQAWVQLDLKGEREPNGQHKMNQYHEKYGFDLEKTLALFPIKELGNPEMKNALLKSLEKGNVQSAVFDKDGFAEKLFIEAAPRFKSINLYDHNGQKLPMDTIEKRFDVSLGKKDDVTVMGKARDKVNGKEQEGVGGKGLTKEGQSKGSRKQKAVDAAAGDGLLPKKRTSKKQGLHP